MKLSRNYYHVKEEKCAHPLHLHLVSRNDLSDRVNNVLHFSLCMTEYTRNAEYLCVDETLGKAAELVNCSNLYVPINDYDFIRNFDLHSCPDIMDTTSQKLFTLSATTMALLHTIKCHGFFLNFLLRILSEYKNFCLETDIVITAHLAFYETAH